MKFKPKKVEYIVDSNNCHICISHACNTWGYPQFYPDGAWLMSRWFYTQKYGPIPKGLIIRHKCDNTKCINIEHLELGTHKDNSNDRKIRGRNSVQDGENSAVAKLNNQIVTDIRNSTLKVKELSLMYNVTSRTIYDILRKKTWKNI